MLPSIVSPWEIGAGSNARDGLSSDTMARLQKCLDFTSYNCRFHDSIPLGYSGISSPAVLPRQFSKSLDSDERAAVLKGLHANINHSTGRAPLGSSPE